MQDAKQITKEGCIFCKIIKGDVPAAKVYDDGKVIAFLDIAPANKGHCLLITKNHYTALLDIPDNELCELLLISKKIAKALSLSCGNGGYNILMNNGSEAGQAVHHAHTHIIPRFKGDGVKLNWRPKKYRDNELSMFKENIKKFL